MPNPAAARFALGRIVATPGAFDALQHTGEDPWKFIMRHVTGDWGELDEHDRRQNEYEEPWVPGYLVSYAISF